MILYNKPLSLPMPLQKSGLILYGDANNPSGNNTLLATSTAMSSWRDLTAYQSIAQATGSKQPIFNQNVINGMPAISFDGTQQSFQVSGLNNLIGAVSKTIFFVVNPTTTSGSRWLLDTNSATNRLILTIGGYDDGNGHAPTFTATTGWQVLEYVLDAGSTTGTIYRNGTQVATGTYTPKAFGATTGIGADSGATFGRFQGSMGASCIYIGVLSSGDRQDIRRYFGGPIGVAQA